jgi:hypothetical protein
LLPGRFYCYSGQTRSCGAEPDGEDEDEKSFESANVRISIHYSPESSGIIANPSWS